MKTSDVGADDVDNFTFRILPILLKLAVILLKIAKGGDVVGQGVEPNINHMARGFLNGDAPIKGGAGNAEVIETWLNKVIHHFGLPAFRGNEFRILIVKSQQILNVFATAEEISGFGFLFAGPAAFGAKMVLTHDLGIGPIGFFVNAIPAFIGRKINVVVFGKG